MVSPQVVFTFIFVTMQSYKFYLKFKLIVNFLYYFPNTQVASLDYLSSILSTGVSLYIRRGAGLWKLW